MISTRPRKRRRECSTTAGRNWAAFFNVIRSFEEMPDSGRLFSQCLKKAFDLQVQQWWRGHRGSQRREKTKSKNKWIYLTVISQLDTTLMVILLNRDSSPLIKTTVIFDKAVTTKETLIKFLLENRSTVNCLSNFDDCLRSLSHRLIYKCSS